MKREPASGNKRTASVVFSTLKGPRTGLERRTPAGASRGKMPAMAVIALCGINVLWAGTTVAAKVALEHISPLTLAFFRFSLSAVLLYATSLALRIDLRVAKSDWGKFWVLGALGLACTYVCMYIGMQHTSASHTALLIASEPVFLSLFSAWRLHETMSTAKVRAIGLGLVGAYLIVANGLIPDISSRRVVGDLIITAGLVFESMSAVIGKRLIERYPPVTLITYEMTIGSLVLAPLCVWELFCSDTHGQLVFTVSSAASLFYLIVPCTVIAYTVWYTVLGGRDIGEMSLFLYIQPVIGAFLGWHFLGDKITVFTIIGAALVLLSLVRLTSAGSTRTAADAR